MRTPISRFRTIGLFEGISAIILFFVAMPLKYFADMPEAVKYVGWAHGILFIIYIMALLQVTLVHRWSILKVAAGVMASLIPFGPFILDARLLKQEEKALEKPRQARQAV